MSKFKKETLERLEKWCDSNDTQFSRFSYEEKNGVVRTYRYDGNGMPRMLNSFFTDEAIERFLNEIEELEIEAREYAEELEKEMML